MPTARPGPAPRRISHFVDLLRRAKLRNKSHAAERASVELLGGSVSRQ